MGQFWSGSLTVYKAEDGMNVTFNTFSHDWENIQQFQFLNWHVINMKLI